MLTRYYCRDFISRLAVCVWVPLQSSLSMYWPLARLEAGSLSGLLAPSKLVVGMGPFVQGMLELYGSTLLEYLYFFPRSPGWEACGAHLPVLVCMIPVPVGNTW